MNVREKFQKIADLLTEIESDPNHAIGFEEDPIVGTMDILLGHVSGTSPEEVPELVSRIVFNPSDTRYLVDDHPTD